MLFACWHGQGLVLNVILRPLSFGTGKNNDMYMHIIGIGEKQTGLKIANHAGATTSS